MRKLLKVMAVVLAMATLITSLAACGKKKEEEPDATPASTQAAEQESAKPEESGAPEEESTVDSYKGTIIGVNFDYEKGLFLEEATTKQMALVQRLTDNGTIKEGKVFDIQRMQVDENTLIANLSGKDDAVTNVTVAIAPYATVDDVITSSEGSETPIEEEPIRVTEVNDEFANTIKESIKTTAAAEGKSVVGDVITTITPEDSPVKGVILEYGYSPNAEATEAEYSVVHAVIPCGKNMINVVAMSQNKESKYDKITIVETIVKSLQFGAEYVNSGNSELEVIEDTNVTEGGEAPVEEPAVEAPAE